MRNAVNCRSRVHAFRPGFGQRRRHHGVDRYANLVRDLNDPAAGCADPKVAPLQSDRPGNAARDPVDDSEPHGKCARPSVQLEVQLSGQFRGALDANIAQPGRRDRILCDVEKRLALQVPITRGVARTQAADIDLGVDLAALRL